MTRPYGLVISMLLVSGCGASTETADAAMASPDDAAADDASSPSIDARELGVDARSLTADDAGSVSLRRCPDAVGDECFLLTPIETGLPATGANADVVQVALRPPSAARGELLLFFNGSGGSPMGGAATFATSWYTVARDEGLHAIGVSYRSDDAVGVLCRGEDACFLATRETILDGRFHTGAAAALSTITVDEGVYARVRAALGLLSRGDPEGGWDAFFDASETDAPTAIRWDRVLASGHSQGGGHAALLGRRHALARVLMLASPCDTSAAMPASWQRGPAGFATDTTTRYFGLASASDDVCTAHAAIWNALGMPASAQDDAAMTCTGSSPHGDPIRCIENAPAWHRMLER